MNLRPELVLGHMPFIGISYQNKARDEQYHKRFSKASAMRRVIAEAMRLGINKFASGTPSSSPLSPLHLNVLQEVAAEGNEIEIMPCIGIPIKLGDNLIDPYRRWATYLQIERRHHPQLNDRMKNDPIMNFREGWKHRLSTSKPYTEKHFRKLTIDWNQLNEGLRFFQTMPISYIELGSETDFLTMAERVDHLGDLLDNVRSQGFSNILLGTHHAGLTIPLLEDKLSGFHGYVTPVNPLGVMMFPTKRSVETAVNNTIRLVYAIKPLAGGRVKPRVAFTYVLSFNVAGCMIGVGTISELQEDIKTAVEVLEDRCT